MANDPAPSGPLPLDPPPAAAGLGHALLRPSVVIPFVVIAMIWGSTWFVIRDQLGTVPPSWSVTYRFGVAAVAMFLLAGRLRTGLAMDSRGHLLAMGVGLTQFCLNFNFVYRAESNITSGIVAVLFGMLMVPNAILARIFLGAAITARFLLGTGVALCGIALLLTHEFLVAPEGGRVVLGVALTVCGIFSASIANVVQASAAVRRWPLLVLIAWAMAWGTLFDGLFALAVSGPPPFPADLRYWGGVAYLALLGSVVTFPLYFKLIREIGPGRAAYSGVLVPVIAMAISTFAEGYVWSRLAIAGAVLAMAGLLVALSGRKIVVPPVE